MVNESRDHETRISRIEGILESVAAKDFVREVNAEMLKDINSEFDEQNNLISEIHKEIKRLDEKHRRLASLGFLFRLI